MRKILALLIVISTSLLGCGGGGGSISATSTLSGKVATGAPLINAAIFVKDVNGKEPVQQNEAQGIPVTTTDGTGAYQLSSDMLTGLKAPLIIRAVGKSVSDQGDDIVVTLHSIATMSQTDGYLNITPLTEAGTLLALGQNPSSAFTDTSGLSSVTTDTLTSVNAQLIKALSLRTNNTLAGLDVFSSSLNTDQNSTDGTELGKAHDLLLDKYAAVSAQASFVLVDRNSATTDITSSPTITFNTDQSEPSVLGIHDNSDANQPSLAYVAKLPSLISRINAQLAKGCTVYFDFSKASSCDPVLLSSNKIFAVDFMDNGMDAEKYMRNWIVNALDIENITAVTVKVEAAFRGQWRRYDGKTYTRIFLRWTRADGDFVIRPAVVQLDGSGDLLLAGNQEKFMIKIFPRLTYAPDSDGTYPYNPKYENSLNLIVKHWYAGQSNVIKGALFQGPGLPTNRSTQTEAFIGEVGNRNGVINGVEIFDRRVSGGCANLNVDPSVYVQKNTTSWNDAWTAFRNANYSAAARATLYDGRIRWRSENTSCNPGFDFMRYYRANDDYTPPKNGDSYTVILYVDKAKADANVAILSEMDNATPHTLQNDDGDPITVYYKTVSVKLMGDAFPRNATLSEQSRPGVKDEVRAMLRDLLPGQDRLIEWARNSFFLEEQSQSGVVSKTPFFNYTAGTFVSAFDQWRPVDTYSGGGTNSPFKKYSDLFTTNYVDLKDYCGRVSSWAGEDVKMYAQKSVRASTSDPWPTTTAGLPSGLETAYFEPASCPDSTTVSNLRYSSSEKAWCPRVPNTNLPDCQNATVKYGFYAGRIRHRYTFDSFTLTTMLQRSRSITWERLRLKEGVGSQNLCSAHYGYWGYRSAYVSGLDRNGRQIMERREVWADFPGLTDITNLAFAISGDFGQDGRAKQVVAPATYASVPTYAPNSSFTLAEMFRSKDVSRPSMTTDAVFFSMNPKVDDYLVVNGGNSPQTGYPLNLASRGLISQALSLNANGACDLVARP